MATCGFNTNMRTLSTNLFHCKQDVKPSKEMCDFFSRSLYVAGIYMSYFHAKSTKSTDVPVVLNLAGAPYIPWSCTAATAGEAQIL